MYNQYAKLQNGELVMAGKTLKIGNAVYSNPSQQQYLSQGWKIYVDQVPEYDGQSQLSGYLSAGYDIVPNGYEEDRQTITRLYEIRPVETKVSFQISKLKLMLALSTAGLWEPVKNWMKGFDVSVDGVNINCWEAFEHALVLDTSNSMFEQYLDIAKRQFAEAISSEQVDAMLKQCRAD